eukprot:760862-Hanusia_phi.AAC.3
MLRGTVRMMRETMGVRSLRNVRGQGNQKRSKLPPHASSRRPAELLQAKFRQDSLSVVSGNKLVPSRARPDSLKVREDKLDSLTPFHYASSALSLIRGGTDALCVVRRPEALSLLRRRRDALSTITRRRDALSLIRRRQNELKVVETKKDALCPIKWRKDALMAIEGRRRLSIASARFALNSTPFFEPGRITNTTQHLLSPAALSHENHRRFTSESKSPKKIRAVIFDLGGVLLQSPFKEIEDFERDAQVPVGSIFGNAARLGESGAYFRLERGEITLEQFLPLFKHELESNGILLKRDVSELFARIEKALFPVRQDMIHVIKSLKAEGIKTAALTNNWKRDNGETFTHELGALQHIFDVIIESALVGIRKPDAKIFQLVLDSLKVENSQEVVFLDDMGPNLKGATTIGIQTIKVEVEYMHAIRELETLVGFPLLEYVPGTINVRSHLQIHKDSLSNYISQTGPSTLRMSGPVSRIRQFGHGQSNPTYHVTLADGRELVLRKKPPGKILKVVKMGAHAVEREFQVLSSLKKLGFPVPACHFLCEEDHVLGTPFYVMDYVKGTPPTFFWIHSCVGRPAQRGYRRGRLASIWKGPAASLISEGSNSDSQRENFFQRQIGTWTKQFEASKSDGCDYSEMEALIRWLNASIPPENKVSKESKACCSFTHRVRQATIVHGDFRLDNLIFEENSSKW